MVNKLPDLWAKPWASDRLCEFAHTLPTSGSARFSSPLGVYSFLKRTSVASVTRGDLQGLQEAARTLARMEGLSAHANAVEVRLSDE